MISLGPIALALAQIWKTSWMKHGKQDVRDLLAFSLHFSHPFYLYAHFLTLRFWFHTFKSVPETRNLAVGSFSQRWPSLFPTECLSLGPGHGMFLVHRWNGCTGGASRSMSMFHGGGGGYDLTGGCYLSICLDLSSGSSCESAYPWGDLVVEFTCSWTYVS